MKILYKLLITLSGFLLTEIAMADSMGPPEAYAVEAGKYIFVMHTEWSQNKKYQYSEYQQNMFKDICLGKKHGPEERQMCRELKAIKRYHRTGLYRKGKSKPLWTVDWYAAEVELLPDGEHLIRFGPWAGSTTHEALSFFKRDKLIAEYKIQDLVDDNRRLSRTASHFTWQSTGSLDYKAYTYNLRTKDDNEYTFDIRTGRIIRFVHHYLPEYVAEIVQKNGVKTRLQDVTSCTGLNELNPYVDVYRMEHILVTTTDISTNSSGSEFYKTLELPFEEIKHFKFVRKISETRFMWAITHRSGKITNSIIEAPYVSFCGKNQDGSKVEVLPNDIYTLTLSRDTLSEKPVGIRTVDLRMRWDVKNWEIAREAYCKKTGFARSLNLDDVTRLLTLYRYLDCAPISDSYIHVLADLGRWAIIQPVTTDMIVMAEDLARLQTKVGLYKHVLSLYEYALSLYQNDGRNSEHQVRKKIELIEKIIETSHRAGLSIKAKSYKKKLADANAQLEQVKKAEKLYRNLRE